MINLKKKPIREPCDWWFHTNAKGEKVKSWCANPVCANRGSNVCDRNNCFNYTINRNQDPTVNGGSS